MLAFHVNGKTVRVDVDPETPLLWVLRDTLHLTGKRLRRLPIGPEDLKA